MELMNKSSKPPVEYIDNPKLKSKNELEILNMELLNDEKYLIYVSI